MNKAFITLLAAALLLSACVTSSGDGAMTAETRKGGFAGLNTLDAVEVSTQKAFAERQKIVIGGFKVGFNESKRMSKKAGGGLLGGGFGGKSTGLVTLEGVSEATKQSITNKAYDDFVSALKAQGYTVVPRSQFVTSAHYEGTKEYDFPYTNDTSGFLSSYGVAKYYSPNAIGSKQPVFMGEIEGVTGGFGFGNPMNAAGEFGKETGIAVLNVAYFIDFAGSDGHGNYWTSSSSLKVGQMLSVDKGFVGLTAGHGGTFSTAVGNMTLGQPIASDKEFATIEDASSGTEKGVETAANIFSAVLGGGTNQTRKFTYKANGTKYKAAAMDVLSKSNKAFAEKMKALQ